MTLLDAMMKVAGFLTWPGTVVAIGAVMVIAAILIGVVAIVDAQSVRALGRGPIRATATYIALVVAIWLGGSLILWGGSSGSGAEWIPR